MTETLDRPVDQTTATVPNQPSVSGGWLRLLAVIGATLAVGYLFGWVWVAAVVALVISVFLHETGHFMVARAAGMKVSEFFISFGPRIWSFRRGETEYGLKTVPVGAYVRIVGMSNLEDIDPADEAHTYRAKSYPKRLAVVVAGPFANFALAMALFVIAFVGFGVRGTDWTISTIVRGSAAEAAGFQVGDQLVRVGDTEVGTWEEFGDAVAASGTAGTDVVVVRDGQQVVLPVQAGWRLDPDAVALVPPLTSAYVIEAVNGQPVDSYDEFRQVLGSLPPGTADIEFVHGGFAYHAPDVKVPVELPAEGSRPFFGVSPEFEQVRMAPVEAVGESFATIGSLVASAGEGLTNLFSPDGLGRYAELFTAPPADDSVTVVGSQRIIPVEDEAPPAVDPLTDPANEVRPVSILGMGRLLGQAADSGVANFIFLLAVFNLMLGLFNLLPLPPLDGGHALVATYEAIRGKITGRAYRVDMARLMPVTYAVVFLLLGLGLTSIYLDAVSPLANPYGP